MNLNWSNNPETLHLVINRRYFEPCDLEIWRMTLKNKRTPLLCYLSFVHHFVAIGEFKLELQSGNAQSGWNSMIFFSRVTLKFDGLPWKNNRTPLLSNVKRYASFHHHLWIQTGVTVRKRFSWVLTSVTLTFYLWPWPFAWTSLLSKVINPENLMMIRWQEHREKGVTDGRTDGQTDGQDH